MKNTKKSLVCGIFTAFCVCLVLSLSGYAEEVLFQGTVHFLDQENVSLAKKFDFAWSEFQKSEKGEYYLAGYAFLSRHQIHIGDKRDSPKPYRVTIKNNEIKLRRKSLRLKRGICISTDDESGPAGILFLHRISGKGREIVDAQLIDLKNTVEFKDAPLFWLGDAEDGESLQFCEGLFEDGNSHLRKTMLFVIGSHVNPKACDFLRSVALGNYTNKLKESAIFWLGNYKSEKSFNYLKEIYRKEKGTKLRKQVVFALHLSDTKEAVAEMIKIAKTSKSREVRKNAIFWLGQKASEECVKALKDVLEESKDIDLKKSAVFAISQLPKEKSVPMLIDIAKSNKSPSVRKNAIFWLGQTGSEEALEFFEEILFKK